MRKRWRWSAGEVLASIIFGFESAAATSSLARWLPARRGKEPEFNGNEDFGAVLLQTRSGVMLASSSEESPALPRSQLACVSEFVGCWNQERGHWGSDAFCRSSFVRCRKMLCTQYMPNHCANKQDAAAKMECGLLSNMCHHTQARDASGKALQVDHPLYFLHLPKNAGSTIEASGKNAHVRWGRHFTWGTIQMPDGSWCNKYHVPPVYLPDPELYLNGEVFCVVRHPFDRAVSEYKYLLQMPWGGTWIQLPEGADRCHPSGLNNYLQRLMSSINAGYPFINDCHMVKQTEYIWGLGQEWCQDVIPIENLSEEFEKLMKRVGYNVTLFHETNKAVTCENLTRDSLDPTTKSLLRTYYKEDFLRLNYSWDD